MKHILPLLLALISLCTWADADVIREQPEGSLRTYLRHGKAMYAFYGEPSFTTQDYTVLQMVTAPDGRTVYMKDPISQANAGTWVQGRIEADGRVHVPLGQYVQYFDQGYGWQTCVLRMMQYDETYGAQYYIDTTMDEVTYTFSPDGESLSMDPLTDQADIEGYPCAMYALVYDDDNSFVGYADYESAYTPYNLSFARLPEGLPQETWQFSYSNARPGETESIPVVRQGDLIYFAGMSVDDPEAAVVARVDGDHMYFASDQYVGCNSGFLLYAGGVSYETKTFYDEEWGETYTTHAMTPASGIEFVFDAESHSLRPVGDMALILNMGTLAEQGINYMSVALDPVLILPEGSTLTGLSSVRSASAVESIYSLSGQRQQRSVRGIQIVNGRKHLK